MEKGNLFIEEKTLAYLFSSVIDCEKHHGTLCKGLKGSLTFTVEDIRSFLCGIGCWKHKVLKKKATCPVKKRFWPNFSGIIECEKPQGQIIGVQKYSDNNWGSYKMIFVTTTGLLKTTVLKKGILSIEKIFA